MREIPKVKPSMGAWVGRVGEGGPERLERERKSSRRKERHDERRAERWVFLEDGSVSLLWLCGSLAWWFGTENKITLPGITTLLWCLLLEEDTYLFLTQGGCFFYTFLTEDSCQSVDHSERTTLLRQDQWISAFVLRRVYLLFLIRCRA